ncbi:MAG TPA: efflux RND transporter periplasmic adaptor subunit [Nevskiaceae bacterium]|nr:efflux RND transporter periplasmic adaptor subunit [Nevskiaceae bacterium]
MTRFALLLTLLLTACQPPAESGPVDPHDAAAAQDETVEKGPRGGRLLREGDLSVELAIFEDGVPPEYRAWVSRAGQPVAPAEVDLEVTLERLGGRVDRFRFRPEGDYLRGDGVVAEPHSFTVSVRASHAGQRASWRYDSFEGRTTIPAAIAEAAGVRTGRAGPATLVETVRLYGQVVIDPARQRAVSARYPGLIRAVRRQPGETVKAGEVLAVVESNESLREVPVTAPIDGVVLARDANVGEQSGERVLFTIADTRALVAVLSVFPRQRSTIPLGAEVRVRLAEGADTASGRLDRFDPQAGSQQAVLARVPLIDPPAAFLPGSFVSAEVVVARREVPLAVRSEALQAFRDFTVVYAQVGETYEVRMLELGAGDAEWTEVRGGIEPGAVYVTEGSFLIKADIEKSGAAHDH